MRKTVTRFTALILAFITAFFALCACSLSGGGTSGGGGRKSPEIYDYFNTVATLYSFAGDTEAEFEGHLEAFEEELKTCHEIFDIYNEYDGINNAMTVNKNAGIAPVKVDKRLIDLLVFAKEMHQKTDGAVNVAMGAVLEIWHFYRKSKTGVPSQEELNAAAQFCDIDAVIINEEESTVYLAVAEMSLDLGAIAKGYAIDLAANVLRQRGADAYAIDVGGNLYAIGTKKDGTAFKTGIENPDGGDYPAYLDVSDGAVATSGDYQFGRSYTYNGVKYHHIINHKTLFPVYLHRSVSVYSDSAALSDALSTALFNLSREEGEALVRSFFPTVREVIYIGEYGVSSFKN